MKRLLLLLLVACANKPPSLAQVDNTDDASEFNLLPLVNNSVPLFAGSSRAVPIAVERLGLFRVPITITATGLPEGVTAAPITLDLDVTEAVMTLTAAASAPASVFVTFTLTAVGAALERTTTAQTAVLRASVVTAPVPRLAGINNSAVVRVQMADATAPTFDVPAAAEGADWRLSLSVPADTAEGDDQRTLTVRAYDTDTALQVTVPVRRTLDVLVRNEDLVPEAGATLRIGNTTLTTGANGRASFTGVSAPYTLYAHASETGTYVYDSATRLDPVVFLDQPATAREGQVLVALRTTGGAPAPVIPSGSMGRMAVTRQGTDEDAPLNPGENASVAMYLSWATGEDEVLANLRYMEWTEDGNGFPDTYTRYGNGAAVSVLADDIVFPSVVVRTDVTTETLAGAVVLPSGFVINERLVFASYGGLRDRVQLLSDTLNTSPSFSYHVPATADGNTVDFWVQATRGQEQVQRYVAGITPGATVTLHEPVILLEPLPGITDASAATLFKFTPSPASGLQLLALNCQDTCLPNDSIRIITPRSEVRLTDFTGLSLRAASTYAWSAGSESVLQSVDDALGTNPGLAVLFEETGDINHENSFSLRRQFTTP